VPDRSEKILTGCDRATDLVRHFLATAGRRQPEKQLVRLQQVVSEVFKLLQPTYGLNITFHNTVDGENDAVWAEPALVFQVLMNLCVNGAQAMSDSGGTITVGLMEDPKRQIGNRRPRYRSG
jgi:signal transduction histidine kinase